MIAVRTFTMGLSRHGRASSFRRRRVGVAMIEVVVATLILGSTLVAALSMLSSATRSRRVQAAQRLGPALARQWLTEILQADYENIETTLANGTIDGWQREITVEYVTPEDPSVRAGYDRGIKRITVTATAAGGRSTSLAALRCGPTAASTTACRTRTGPT